MITGRYGKTLEGRPKEKYPGIEMNTDPTDSAPRHRPGNGLRHRKKKETMTRELSPVVCRNCALLLVRRCYGKHWWFRLVREPLVCGMRILARWNGIDARRHAVTNPECHGCVRFMKSELEEKSPAFRFLNEQIGPWFRTMRDSMLTQAELDEAKRHAREMMESKGKD